LDGDRLSEPLPGAAVRENQAVAGDRRGDTATAGVEVGPGPILPAVLGVVAGNAGGAGDDQLGYAFPLRKQKRRRVAGAEPFALDLPGRFARLAVQRQQFRLAVLVVGDDDLVLENHRGGAGPVLAGKAAEVAVPDQLALEVVGVQGDVLAVPEQGVNAFAVGRRGGAGERVFLVHLGSRAGDRLRPDDLAVGGVEAQEQALRAVG